MKVVYLGQPIPAKRVTRNSLWRARAYAEYKEDFAWYLKSQLKPKKPITNDIAIEQITFYRKGKLRADIDNLLKTVMESLALSGYIANDKQVVAINRMKMVYESDNPRIEIIL